jgi:hypothetical protein
MDTLLAKRALIEQQLKAIAARQNAAERKAEQRAKFLLGEAVLERASTQPALLEQCCAALSPKEQQHVRNVVAALRSRQDAT